MERAGIDTETERRLRARFGPAIVEPWLDRLPALLARLTSAWELELGAAVGHGSTSLVRWCRAAGRPAVLKLVPEPAIARAESVGLRAWQDTGRVPALLGHDPEGALLLAAIGDGRKPVIDTAEALALLRALHAVPPPSQLPTLAERVRDLTAVMRRRGVLPRRWDLAVQLASDPVEPVLLHGDLHPANVVARADRRLVAIDPRPCVGDPLWDAIDLPVEARALGLDAGRLAAWRAAFA